MSRLDCFRWRSAPASPAERCPALSTLHFALLDAEEDVAAAGVEAAGQPPAAGPLGQPVPPAVEQVRNLYREYAAILDGVHRSELLTRWTQRAGRLALTMAVVDATLLMLSAGSGPMTISRPLRISLGAAAGCLIGVSAFAFWAAASNTARNRVTVDNVAEGAERHVRVLRSLTPVGPR